MPCDGTPRIAIGIPALNSFPFIRGGFTPANGEFHLDAPLHKIQGEGNERIPFLLDVRLQLANLCAMDEQFTHA
jgi:hypothetical protein